MNVKCTATLLVCLVILAAPIAAAPLCTPAPKSVGPASCTQPITCTMGTRLGNLGNPNSCEVDGKWSEYFEFEGSQGDSVVVTMVSTEIDDYLKSERVTFKKDGKTLKVQEFRGAQGWVDVDG